MTLAFKIWDISDLPLIGFLKPVRYEMPKRGCSSTLFWFKSGLLHKRLNMVFKIKAFKMLLGWLLRTSSRSLLKYNFLSFLLVFHPTLVVFCISRKRSPDLYYLFFSEQLKICQKDITTWISEAERLLTSFEIQIPFDCWFRCFYQFGPNISTTPLQQWGFRQCLPVSWTTIRGKHCRYPIAINGSCRYLRARTCFYLLQIQNCFDFIFRTILGSQQVKKVKNGLKHKNQQTISYHILA